MKGTPDALETPNVVFISQRSIPKYFGHEDPIGKLLSVQSVRYQGIYRVVGILANPRPNTSIPFDFLASSRSVSHLTWATTEWAPPGQAIFATYVKLRDPGSARAVEQKLTELRKTHFSAEVAKLAIHRLQPLTRVHLHSAADFGILRLRGRHGDIEVVRRLAVVAGLVLLVACINYVNLATATASLRSREVGIRKTVGARRGQVIQQFLAEGCLTVGLSAVIAVGLAQLALPQFEHILGKPLLLGVPPLSVFALSFLVLALVALLAAAFPALFLSRLSPSRALRPGSGLTEGRTRLRTGMIVVQFATAIAFIASTLTIRNQLDYIRMKDIGYSSEALISFSIRKPVEQMAGPSVEWSNRSTGGAATASAALSHRLRTVADVFRSVPGVLAAARSAFSPPTFGGFFTVSPANDRDRRARCQKTIFDEYFLDTYQIPLVSGRGFSLRFPTDADEAVLINESAVKALDLSDPIGTSLVIDGFSRPRTVIGVIKDFHTRSLREPVYPLIVHMVESRLRTLSLRVPADDFPVLRERLEEVWRTFVPTEPFAFSRIEDRFLRLYGPDHRLADVLGTMAGLSIFISCTGLFGLATFTIERRTKEIGTRRVLGASLSSLTTLLSWDFLKLVILSSLIATPPAYYLMDRWLSGFAYRIELGPSTFLASTMAACVIALLTVGYRAFTASIRNPVDSLRYE